MGSKKSAPAPAPKPAPVQEVIVTDRAAKGSNEATTYKPPLPDQDKTKRKKDREKMGSVEPASSGLSVG